MAEQGDVNTVADEITVTPSFSMPARFDQTLTELPVMWLDLRAQQTTELVLAMRALGLNVLEVRNTTSATEALSQQNFGAVIICCTRTEAASMLRGFRSKSELATLPVLILGTDIDGDHISELLELGATDVISLDTPHRESLARLAVQLRAVTSWNRVVETKVLERSALSQALAQVAPQTTPELTADVICFELSLVRKFSSVAVIGFFHDGSAVVLGHHGQAMPRITTGTVFKDTEARYLQEQARNGPWIQQLQGLGGLIPSPGSATEQEVATSAAIAPLTHDGEILGLLLLGHEPGRTPTSAHMAETITAAIDFARVAVGLLAPGLRERDNANARRLGLDIVIKDRLFTPVYQAIVELETGTTVAYEALCRFHDGSRPDLRFAEAARAGVGKEMELAVLDEAIKQAHALPKDQWLSINVSPYVLLDHQSLARVFAGADRPLTLELTEHDRVDDYDAIKQAMKMLGQDVRMSVDDAGSGFASLQHVLALDPDFIKLDHSWVSGIHLDPARRALVAGLQHFAQETGAEIIAEGIEEEIELQVLQELHVKHGQGYFLARPQPISELAG